MTDKCIIIVTAKILIVKYPDKKCQESKLLNCYLYCSPLSMERCKDENEIFLLKNIF